MFMCVGVLEYMSVLAAGGACVDVCGCVRVYKCASRWMCVCLCVWVC